MIKRSRFVSCTHNFTTYRNNVVVELPGGPAPSTEWPEVSEGGIVVGCLGVPIESFAGSPITPAQELVVIFLVGNNSYIESLFFKLYRILLKLGTIRRFIS